MLEGLSRFENLGTPGLFMEMFQLIGTGGTIARKDIDDHFRNRLIDGEAVFDGCLPMAIVLGIVIPDAGDSIRLEVGFGQFLVSDRYLRAKVIERLFVAVKEDPTFLEMFSSRYLSYDVIYHLIQIENSAFKFKYANFRKFVIAFGVLSPHPDPKIRKLIVNPKHRRVFDVSILQEVKRRKIGIENLEASLEQRQIAGMEAEDFVVAFEKTRMSEHPSLESIQRISDYDVAAGYDVVSFETLASSSSDRFIEVKSCSVDRRFYWSRNEVEQARIKREQYFLYLVDPGKIKRTGYQPIMIQNPYESVFMNDEWKKEEQSWLFQPENTERS